MKKTITLIIILVACNLFGYGQAFAPIGAIWHYSQGTPNPNMFTYKTIESIKDTVIEGKNCRKLIEVQRIFDTSSVSYHYFYSENDSVFFYANNTFNLLYDFNAEAGDTITITSFDGSTSSSLKIIVDSVGLIDVNGETRKIQYISHEDYAMFDFGKHIIKNIGSTMFMFPKPDEFTFSNGPLRCYQDEDTGIFINPLYSGQTWNMQDCEEIITGIDLFNDNLNIVVFPNPANNQISLSGLNATANYIITNREGQLVLSGEIIPSETINIEQLPNNLYLIHIQDNSNLITKKFIKQ